MNFAHLTQVLISHPRLLVHVHNLNACLTHTHTHTPSHIQSHKHSHLVFLKNTWAQEGWERSRTTRWSGSGRHGQGPRAPEGEGAPQAASALYLSK